MKKVIGRVGSLLLAFLFLATTIGFSVAVIIQANQQDKQNKQQEDLQKALQQQGQCQIGSSEGEVMPVPQVFIPQEDINKLSTVDLKEGSGEAAKAGDCLHVKYLGSLAKDGKVFDQNFDKPELLKFQLGGGLVIKGWDEGLVGMKVGGERRILIPSDLGYGSQGAGESIPPDSDLVFDVVLVKIGD